MASTSVDRVGPDAVRARRYLLFRSVAVLVALVFLVLFGVWRSILTPWVSFPDGADHGWVRTPELHGYADAAAAVAMGAVAAGALLAALRPARRSGLVAWVGASLTITGFATVAGELVQKHTGVFLALLEGAVTLALTAVPFVLLHPDRPTLLRGGAAGAGRPAGAARLGLVVLGAAGMALALGTLIWRVSGGIVESPLEDDVVSFMVLGLVVAVGSRLCLTGREGWRALAVILASVASYAVVGGLSIALT